MSQPGTAANAAVVETRTTDAPTEVFGLLADETRVAILRELHDSDGAVSYSDLRRGANVADSSRFNYHLMQLTGVLVEDVADGYELRPDAEPLFDAVFGAPLFRAGSRPETAGD